MNTVTRMCAVAVLISLAGATAAEAAGWSWNPFSKEAKAQRTTTTRTPLVDGTPLRQRVSKPPQKSPWQRMTTGTRRAWGSTVDVLTFKKLRNKPQPVSGQTTRWKSNRGQKSKGQGWFGSWFRDEPKKIETVDDFLAQPSPRF